jgi:RHS repeat-associated protein
MMRLLRFAFLLAPALAFFMPARAHAQAEWYPSYPGYGANCSKGTGCSSATASCQSFAAQGVAHGTARDLNFSVSLIYHPGTNEVGYCTADCNFYKCPATLYVFCPSGYEIDINSTGCSPKPAFQNPELIGGEKTCPPQPAPAPPVPCESKVDNAGKSFAGEPIDIASGNMFYAVTDYATSGQNVLRFTRYYNSRGTYYNTLGANWRSNFDRTLVESTATQMIATRPSGQILNFNLVDGAWMPNADVDITLSHSGSAWTLTDHDDTVETYTGSTPVLAAIKSRNGYTQTLSYFASGRLETVTDSYGRRLSLNYGGNAMLETVLTPDGTTITYGYTSSTSGLNLTSVTFPTSPATNLTYLYGDASLLNALTAVLDENGNQFLTWTYDSFGRALTSQTGTGANANMTTVSYDDATGAHTVTNALGVSDTYTFTTLQNVPKITGISRAATATTAAATRTFTYDANGYMASATDWNGNETLYTNDKHGQPTTIVEASGTPVERTTTIAYDTPTLVHLPATVITPGVTATYTYDGNGEQLTRTLTDTTTTTAPYSTNGQTRTWTNTWSDALLASVKTPKGNTTQFGYDGTGALTSVTDALSHVTTITSHTGGGLPETVVDPNGVTTTLAYNPRQWLTSSAVSGTGGTFTTSFTLDATGQLKQTTLPDASYIADAYDTAHRLIKITDALGENVNLTLDAMGDPMQGNIDTASAKLTWKHSGNFDDLGRLLVDTAGAGQTKTLTYDPDGNALSVTDGRGNETRSSYDALNRLSTTTDPHGGVTTITYDAHDRIISVKDANGHITSYVRDGFGDVIQQTSPDSGKTVYYYDADGNLTEQEDAASVHTYHTYDALDRVATTTYPGDSTENVVYNYDQPGHGFGIGRLTSVKDAVGTLSRNYDERGNLLAETRTHGAVTLTTAYSYDPASRIASITYPSGSTVTYSRDVAGQITNVATPRATVASNITHLPFGPANSWTFGNGVTDARTFDLDYRMTGIQDAVAGAASVQSLAYAYDLANNLKTITDSVHTGNSQTIAYDALNRLSSATAADYGAFTYTYDKVGNRLTEGRAGGAPTNDYSYIAGTDRLSGLSIAGVTIEAFTYTPTGNIVDFMGTGEPTVSLLYNKANRVGTIMENGTQIAAYTYDGFGQRLVKNFAGTPAAGTLFAYSQAGSLLEETNISGTPRADYIYLDSAPIGDLAPTSKTLYYLHTDHLGTPQLATNNAKTTEWQAIYEPFGWQNTVEGTITQNLRLPGQYFDSETTSYHNGFRDYVAILGRYGQTDPIGLAGGMNSYAYAAGNPMTSFDTTGEDVIVLINTSGFHGFGHAGLIVGSDSSGWTYFSKDGGPYSQLTFQTLEAFWEWNNVIGGGYNEALQTSTSQSTDHDIISYAGSHVGDTYNGFTSNCASFVYDSLHAGGLDELSRLSAGVSIPNLLSNNLLTSPFEKWTLIPVPHPALLGSDF